MLQRLTLSVTKPSTVSVFQKFLNSSNVSAVASKTEKSATQDVKNNYQILDTRSIKEVEVIDVNKESSSVLEPCNEDISHVAPFLKPAFNFAAYVNKSETLQQFVNLGVDLHKLERNAEIPPYLLQLDLEKDVKSYVLFLTELGLESDEIGNFITKNPFIFKHDLNDLITRINYLKSKKFEDAMISRIVKANPIWLNCSTQEIDKRLGYFQHTFNLTGNELRCLAAKRPKLITCDLKHVKLNTFVIQEEMGFTPEETKQILLEAPTIFTKNQGFILKTFEYVHKVMKIPLEMIVKMPKILTFREFKVKQRHMFLEQLGKTQYDPKQPNYISLMALVTGTDAVFSTEIAGSSIQAYNAFLKSL